MASHADTVAPYRDRNGRSWGYLDKKKDNFPFMALKCEKPSKPETGRARGVGAAVVTRAGKGVCQSKIAKARRESDIAAATFAANVTKKRWDAHNKLKQLHCGDLKFYNCSGVT